MPNAFLDARDRWLDLSEIDYLGHFVRAWLAFNAWYRSAHAQTQDRAIIEDIKWQANPMRNGVLPLLTAETSDGAEFRSNIGLLHQRLENYRLEVGKGNDKSPISFQRVFLKERPSAPQTSNYMNWTYEVRPGAVNGSVVCEVKDRNGTTRFLLNQNRYDLAGLEGAPDFAARLNANQQGQLRGLYIAFSPRLVADLTNCPGAGARQIATGAVNMMCSPENLFAGIVENVYLMRCSLFHGELVPTKDATACYEPAYRIVRRFLASIN